MERIEQINKYIDDMPALPITVTKIFEVANNLKSTAKDLNDVISIDPVLTGKVLKLINSAYYGMSEQVTSIVKAVIMLGLNTLKNLALSSAVISSVSDKNSFIALNLEGFWRHSIGVGVTAKRIAMNLGMEKKVIEEFFIAGLLHDIGKITLNKYFPKLYLEAIKLSDINHKPLYQEETEQIHVNHTVVGGLIAKKWNLSKSLSEVILKHHSLENLDEAVKRVVYIVNLANTFCNINNIGFSGDLGKESFNPQALEYLNLSETALFEILQDVQKDIQNAEIFLKISREE